MNTTLMEQLASLNGDALERAYEVLRVRVIAQRATLRAQHKAGIYLMLLTERTRAGGIVPIRAILSNKPCRQNYPTDTVLVHTHFAERPSDEQVRKVVDGLFLKLNKRHAAFTQDARAQQPDRADGVDVRA